MRIVHVVAVLGLVLSTGACAAKAFGPGASGANPPPPRPGMVIQTWEHYCVTPNLDFEEVLGRAGQAGFEMVGVATTDHSLLVCFKRPVIEQPPAPPAATSPISPAAAGS